MCLCIKGFRISLYDLDYTRATVKNIIFSHLIDPPDAQHSSNHNPHKKGRRAAPARKAIRNANFKNSKKCDSQVQLETAFKSEPRAAPTGGEKTIWNFIGGGGGRGARYL